MFLYLLSYGQLGYENTDYFNDSTNFGVDIDFGSKIIEQIAVGDDYTCALTDDGRVLCWGLNDNGQLGKGNTDNLGDGASEMGDYLGIVTLGSDFNGYVTEICVGGGHSCALNDQNEVKCWGENEDGQLGQGDTNNRGDAGGEMGNHLDSIDFGTGFYVEHVVCGKQHSCVVSTDGDIKCWGMSFPRTFFDYISMKSAGIIF